jgi:hypothetical protein
MAIVRNEEGEGAPESTDHQSSGPVSEAWLLMHPYRPQVTGKMASAS